MAKVTVRLSRAQRRTAILKFKTIDGTATAGSDYTKKSGKLRFRRGQRRKVVKVAILADSLDEPDEQFSVRLSRRSGPKFRFKTGKVTIVDDDAPSGPATTADLTVAGGQTPAPVKPTRPVTFTFTISNAGPLAAENVAFTDQLPPKMTYSTVDAASPGCTASGDPNTANQTVTCPVGGIAPGGSASVTFTAFPAQDTAGQSLSSNASVTTSTPQTNTTDDAVSLQTQVSAPGNTAIGSASLEIPRGDTCGDPNGRKCESFIGDVTTDAMRTQYGTEFAVYNSGSIRAALTCPTADIPDDSCPAYTPPPYPITDGQVLSAHPFGNRVMTGSVTGTVLKQMLENSVSPGTNQSVSRFLQISGLCFTYDKGLPVGARVTGAVRQVGTSCSGSALDLASNSATYTIAVNSFMSGGGDGYSMLTGVNWTTRSTVVDVIESYVTANSPLANPTGDPRITCSGAFCP